MDTFSMQCFVTTCDFRNITRAARILNITQPALSRRIQSLEEELGTALLVRESHSVRTTPAGEVFLTTCVKILRQMDELKSSISRFIDTDALYLGFNQHALLSELVGITAQLCDKEEEFMIKPMLLGNREGMAALRNGSIDVYYTMRSMVVGSTGVSCYTVLENDMAVLVPQGHRLWHRSKIQVQDLTDEMLLISDGGREAGEAHDLALSHFVQNGLNMNSIIVTDSAFDMIFRVATQKYLGITGTNAADSAMIPSTIKKIPFDLSENDGGDLVLAYFDSNEKASKFVEALKK